MSNYDVFVDENAIKSAWESDKTKWRTYLVAKYSKKVAKSIAKAAMNHCTFSIGGVIFEAPAAYLTHRHIENLHAILISDTTYKCDCAGITKNPLANCTPRLVYAISQKEKKSVHVKRAAIPVFGTLDALRSKFHAITKSDRGGDRELNAKLLRNAARNGCPQARAAIAELLGNFTHQDSWRMMFAVCDWEEGWKVLKDKLAST
jgi:hypothetical protein